MDVTKRRALMKVFITSQFSYCPLVWMFHSRNMKHTINRIYQGALQLMHENPRDVTFTELLAEDNSVSVHQKKSSNSCN